MTNTHTENRQLLYRVDEKYATAPKFSFFKSRVFQRCSTVCNGGGSNFQFLGPHVAGGAGGEGDTVNHWTFNSYAKDT